MTVWNQLMSKNREDCYTITQKRPARMDVDRTRVTIVYRSGRTLPISRDMIEEAYNRLVNQRTLTIDDAYEITRNKDRTDRIMAVLDMLVDVTSSSNPRELHYR